jgi:LPXTG-motif cell wall-anchored protein
MRRALGVIASAFVAVIVMAGTALAEYPPSPDPTTVVKSSGGGGTTAFTGGEISTAVLAVGILAVLGVAALFVARRRSAQGV